MFAFNRYKLTYYHDTISVIKAGALKLKTTISQSEVNRYSLILPVLTLNWFTRSESERLLLLEIKNDRNIAN